MTTRSTIPSPARSEGAAPRRQKSRRTLSVASPARSDTSGKLVSVVAPYINDDKFTLSPMQRRSVLPDDTKIEAPRRASWWKRLDGSSRDVLEALDTNKMRDNLLLEEFEVEVEKGKQSQSVPDSSDNESVASIVVPQRRLFNQKKQTKGKFGEIMGSRKSNVEDHDNTINFAPKTLFNKAQPRNRPVFPAALLNSTNKTIDKTVEPDVNERQGRNLFGQAATKRKNNMFTDFVLSESEDDSDIQHKVFGFRKSDNKRISLATRNRRMPSLTPSMTTDLDIDDWKLLPSSTMIGTGTGAWETSRITNDEEMEQMEVDNQDVTLTEVNQSLKIEENNHKTNKIRRTLNRTRFNTSTKNDVEFDKTVTNENIDLIKNLNMELISESMHKSQRLNNSMPLENRKEEALLKENNINERTTITEACVEHRNREKMHYIEPTLEDQVHCNEKEIMNENQDDEMEAMLWNDNDDDKVSEDHSVNKSKNHNSAHNEESDDGNLCEESDGNDGADTKTNERVSQSEIEDYGGLQEDGNLSEQATEVNCDNAEETENEVDLGEASENIVAEVIEEKGDQNKLNEDKDDLDDNIKNHERTSHVSPSKSVPGRSQNNVESSVEEEEIQQENEIVVEADLNEASENIDAEVIEEKDDQNKLNEDKGDLDDNKNHEQTSHVSPNKTLPGRSQNNVESSVEEEEIQQENEIVVEADLDEASENIDAEVIEEKEDQNKFNEDIGELDDNNKNHEQTSHVSPSKTVQSSRSQKSVESPTEEQEEEIQQENEVVEETAKDKSEVKSPEAVLRNMSNDNISFKPIGRSTSFNTTRSNKKNDKSEVKSPEAVLRNMSNDNISFKPIDRSTSFNTTRSNKKNDKSEVKSPEAVLRNMSNDNISFKPIDRSTSFNTTRSNKKKDKSEVKSPEAVLRNMSNDNISFKPIGRSTSFRKSGIEDINLKPSLIPIRESTFGSEGSSSAEGSGWDSHRTTRKTLRQTFGKDFTTRKSLRALVMEHSAKRKTQELQQEIERESDQEDSQEIAAEPERDQSEQNVSQEIDNVSRQQSDQESDHDICDEPDIEDSDKDINEQEDSEIAAEPKRDQSEQNVSQEIVNVSRQQSDQESDRDICDEPDIEDSDNDLNEQEDSEMAAEPERYQSKRNVSQEIDNVSRQQSDQESDRDIYDEPDMENSDNDLNEQEDSEIAAEPERDQSEQNVSQEIDNVSRQQSDQESDRDICDEPDREDSDNNLNEHEDSELDSKSQKSNRTVSDNEISEPELDNELSERLSGQITGNEISEEEIEEEISISNRIANQTEIHDVSADSKKSLTRIQLENDEQSDRESDRDMSEEADGENSDDDLNEEDDPELDSRSQRSNRTERIVFDNEMSEQEIDYELSERHSRRITDNEISEQVSEDEVEEEIAISNRVSDQNESHDVSAGTNMSLKRKQLEEIAQYYMEMRLKYKEKTLNSHKQNLDSNPFMSPMQPKRPRIMKPEPIKPKRKPRKPVQLLMGPLPKEFMDDLNYKPPKRFRPAGASWITKRLYNFLENKLAPKYDYRARVRAERLVESIFAFTKAARRRDVAPPHAVDELKREMARLRVVTTHFDFYEFFHEFMPREIRVKVNPDVVNKIPMPRSGVFSDILQARPAADS